MTEKITAVVVTYNRKELLLKTIAALKLQNRRVNEIIIIDNASIDDTHYTLQEAGLLRDETVKYTRLDFNTGGAGGFNVGMKLAIEGGADWIWVMDDDVAPDENCLAELLKWKEFSECLHPRRINTNGGDLEWEHYIDIHTASRTRLNNASFKNGKKITFTNTACFEGMLVSRRLVSLCGLPDPKYFIGEDDTLYGIKASQHTNNAYIRDSIMYRLLPPPIKIPSWRSYYSMRNKFYLFRDASEILKLHIDPLVKAKFVTLRVIELFASLKNGPNFFTKTLKGFFHGLHYINR